MSGRLRIAMTPLRIVALYALVGAVWILFSDRALGLLVRDPVRREALATGKGVAYVAVTAVLLYFLIRSQHHERRIRDAQVRTVLDSMPDAVLVVDRRSIIVDFNPAALALFAAGERRELLVPVAELVERMDLRHVDGRRLDPARTASRRALGGEDVVGFEARMRRLDGREAFISISSSAVRPRPGEPARLAVAVLRDISEVKRFEETREDFLATAAHEFKTPLAVVKAYAQLMHKRGQGDPAALEVIARQIDRLTRMVQQLLEVARFRVGGAELARERFDLPALVAEVAERLRRQSDGHHIVVVVPPTAACVLGDRERIGQVIGSLLENALHFSPQGGEVEAALASDGGEAIISVRDHGLGIPPERQARIFERFYRAHAGTQHDYGGLGVGLGMSRDVVTRHGGRIWFESAPGEGSTFFFSLPLA
ncbi:MAG TPA: ATP-binding protein, partial [Anaeromyxobacteraceae bacterium]|nr:ATP-binding protein [Anaeromyxobacteraceae bacterium]